MTILLRREEVLFSPYQDWLFRVNYVIRGDAATFWRVSQTNNTANLVYDKEGNLLTNLKGKGTFDMYGFYFPFVVEIPRGSYIALEITAIYHYGEDFPLATGDHCVEDKCGIKHAYTVIGPFLETGFQRIVDSDLQACNEKLRRKYLSIISRPCVGIETSPLLLPDPFTAIISNIESDRLKQNWNSDRFINRPLSRSCYTIRFSADSENTNVSINGPDIVFNITGRYSIAYTVSVHCDNIVEGSIDFKPWIGLYKYTTLEYYRDENGQKIFAEGNAAADKKSIVYVATSAIVNAVKSDAVSIIFQQQDNTSYAYPVTNYEGSLVIEYLG